MRSNRIAIAVLALVVLSMSVVIFAQVRRPYHNGSAWSIGYIRMKPGMETLYLNYLAGPWKAEQEALKKDGQIISYMVISTEDHSPNDFNLMLMTEYRDMATMEKNTDKADALMQKVSGDDQKQIEGYKQRQEIRDIIANRLGTEIVLEPRP